MFIARDSQNESLLIDARNEFHTVTKESNFLIVLPTDRCSSV